MNTHNICCFEDLTKIFFQLSSNTHLISSSVELYMNGKDKGQPVLILSLISICVVLSLGRKSSLDATSDL